MKRTIFFILLAAISCRTSLLAQLKFNQTDAYNRSIKLAMVADSTYNIDTLVTITPGNPLLQWKKINGQQYVLLATFMNSPSRYPKGDSTSVKGDIWMFVPRQMKNRLGNAMSHNTDTILRLSEMLGLPPVNKTSDSLIAEIWVRANDVFRPAGNPDITLHRASGVLDTNLSAKYKPWYKAWFNDNIIFSYFRPLSSSFDFYYPWTRMGYTYDWAPGVKRVGLSEFVLRSQSTFWVENVVTPAVFFKN
ncbi:MAG TPA: hypothetical protein VNX40_00715 [Mucilaginibacter sp.]|jgi:hypothetical protein|nr:hypothetical protein [Mucilaginibacter sp.]